MKEARKPRTETMGNRMQRTQHTGRKRRSDRKPRMGNVIQLRKYPSISF